MSYFFFNFQDFLLKRIVSYLQVSLNLHHQLKGAAKVVVFLQFEIIFHLYFYFFIKVFFTFGHQFF